MKLVLRHHPLNLFYIGLLMLLCPALLARAGGSGTWTPFLAAAPISGDIQLSPNGQTMWLGGNKFLGIVNGQPTFTPQIFSAPLQLNGLFTAYDGNGLDNAAHSNVLYGMCINKQQQPVARLSHSPLMPPYIYSYNTGAAQWQPAAFTPSFEQNNWSSAGNNYIRDDNGDLMLVGASAVEISPDGSNWTPRTQLYNYFDAPPPLPAAGGWIVAPKSDGTNLPTTQVGAYTFSVTKTPWDELFTGGEHQFYHSLDNGVTWEWVDALMYQPQRDALGTQWYRNPRVRRFQGHTHVAQGEGRGEVLMFCDQNNGAGVFRYSGVGLLKQVQNGLPASNNNYTLVFRMISTRSGDSYIGIVYKNLSPTPTGNAGDIFRWDGASWSPITPANGTTFRFAQSNSLETDGLNLYALMAVQPSGNTIYQWSPAPPYPPQVIFSGGANATTSPTVTLTTAAAGAIWNPAYTVTGATGALSYVWSARGPVPVQFDFPTGAAPMVYFTAPGNYVVNLQTVDSGTGLTGGASVIVHVNPASGGTAPAISVQPQNQLLVGATATFTLTATGTGPFNYQWFRDGAPVAGTPTARTATLQLSGLTASADNTGYYCVVSNPYGRVTSYSGTLGNPPVITGQPADASVAAGTPITFSVAASGTQPMIWQWYNAATNLPIAAAQMGSYQTSATGQYYVKVTNIFGTTTSRTATLASGANATYTLVVNNGGVGPSMSGGGRYQVGSVASITTDVNADLFGNSGFFFSNWSVQSPPAGVTVALGGTTTSQTTATVGGAAAGQTVTINASYVVAPEYPLGVINGYGNGYYRNNLNQIAIEAIPPPPGFSFDHWIASAPGAVFANSLSASTTVTLSPPQDITVTALYLPPANTLHPTTTSITSHNPDPATIGQMITVTASVSVVVPFGGTPTGKIGVSDGNAICTMTLPANQCNLTPLSTGAKTLTATYNGDGSFAASASPGVNQTVTPAITATHFSSSTATGTGTATLDITGTGCNISDAQFVNVAPLVPPAGVAFPQGLAQVLIIGCTAHAVSVTITYPQPLAAGTQYWKYGPTPTDTSPHWYIMPATIAGNQVQLTIMDGGLGDDDLMVNLSIADPGGPGVPNGTVVFNLDVDANTHYDALTDGLVILRYLFGLTGASLTGGALGNGATLIDPASMLSHLKDIKPLLDVDANGQADALTDGLMIIRYLFGLRGNSLIAGAIGLGATRTTAAQIEPYIQSLMP